MLKIQIDGTQWEKVLYIAIAIVGAAVVAWVLSFINGKVFKAISRKQKGIHLAFFERLNRVIIVVGVFVIAFSALDGTSSVWKTMLGGTAVISAVVAFAAQDVIKDILAGLMISLQRPFEIGDRIELEDGTVGIVEDMTNRHVVLAGVDTTKFVIPNSRINSMKVTNFSFMRGNRSAWFDFPVGYDTDTELAKSVIKAAITASPNSIPGKTGPEGEPEYADVYFLKFADSALILSTTVYYESGVPSEKLIDDINTRVREALNANGIEIPYQYVNVITAPSEK